MFAFKATDSKRLKEIYGSRTLTEVSRSALGDTGKKTRTALSKQVRTTFAITAKTVKDKSYVEFARGNTFGIDIKYRDYRPNLGRFSTSASSRVNVKIKKGRGTKTVKGGFRIDRYGSLIWKRLTAAEAASPKYANRKSKIKVLRTIAIPEMVYATSNHKSIQQTIDNTFESRFDHHFRRKLKLKLR